MGIVQRIDTDAGYETSQEGEGGVNRFDARCELVTVRAPTWVLACDRNGTMVIKMAGETAKQINDVLFWVLKGGVDHSNMVAPDLFDCRVLEVIKR